MGLFSAYKIISSINKIKKGKTAFLSIAQITQLITNMPDAKKNLSKIEFDNVYALYRELQKCNTKMKLNLSGYLDISAKIIKRFNDIAPYEKYSGGNELETTFLMEDLKNHQKEKSEEIVVNFNKDHLETIDYIERKSEGRLTHDDAYAFMRAVYIANNYGKQESIEEFDSYAKQILNKGSFKDAMNKIPFMAGLMYAYQILSKEESDALSEKYTDAIMAKFF